MSIKFVMDSIEGLPKDVAALYEKNDNDQFILTGVEGIVPKSKLDKFRDTNISLMQKLDAYKDIDPSKYKEIMTELEEARIKLEQKGDVDEETINKLVESRVEGIKSSAEEAQAKLKDQLSTTSRQLESLILDSSVTQASSEHKVRTEALTDVMLRAKQVFKLVDGKPVAFDGEGNKLYGSDGTSELSINTWVKGLVKTSPHLFEDSVSGGIRSGSGSFSGDASKLSPSQKISVALNNQ